MSLQGVVDVVDNRDVFHIVQRSAFQQASLGQQGFKFLVAGLGKRYRALFLVEFVILVSNLGDKNVHSRVQIGFVVDRA